MENIVELANRLEPLRQLSRKPWVISRGYSTPEHNKAIGGATNSEHLQGKAADIDVKSIPTWLVMQLWEVWEGGMGKYDAHIHLDTGKKRRWTGKSR